MPNGFSESLGQVVRDYTWLMVDSFFLLILLGLALSYKDFDDPMRLLMRGATVASFGYFWFSGLHLLVYLRRQEQSKTMPALASYGFFALKLGLLVSWGFWAYHRGIV